MLPLAAWLLVGTLIVVLWPYGFDFVSVGFVLLFWRLVLFVLFSCLCLFDMFVL